MLTITSAPASATSLAGGPGSQMSSQIVSPRVVPLIRGHRRRVADLEVALLVEHAVVRQEHLAVDAAHLAVGEHGERVEDVLRVLGEPDQRDGVAHVLRDLVQGPPARRQEMGLEQQVLGRVAVHGQLREHDQLRARVDAAVQVVADLARVAVDVADGRVHLGQRNPQRPGDLAHVIDSTHGHARLSRC